MNEPVLDKSNPRPDHYRPITDEALKKLKIAAQRTADAVGYPVYLFGSVLYKEIPRDIDISVIIPLERYEQLFGKLPETQDDYGKYLGQVFHKSWWFTKHMHFSVNYVLDIKVCPDTWWPEKQKKLLAAPKFKRPR